MLREICFSAVLINGGLGAGSQMRNLNAMYRRLLLREVEDEDNDQRKNKKPGVIKLMSPIQALSYLSQAERAANVGTDFVSEQTFAGGQGASSRTYAVDSIEDQIEVIKERVNEGRKKEADARQKESKGQLASCTRAHHYWGIQQRQRSLDQSLSKDLVIVEVARLL